MTKLFKLFGAILLAAFVFVGCSKEESPFLSKEEAQKAITKLMNDRNPFHHATDVVAILNNDVYYFPRLDTVPRRLTNSPNLVKTEVKLSFDKSQIAYLNDAGHPVIIRASDGQLLQTLTQFSYIDQMDWAKDRLTLYMLSDKVVSFYGDAPSVSQPSYTNPWDEVGSFSMNALGDQAYAYKAYGDFFSHIVYHSTAKGLDITNLNYEYIDFYDNNGNFLVATRDYYYSGFEKVVMMQNYNFYSQYEWDFEAMNSPAFNAETEVLVYGTMESTPYKIKAVYLGTTLYERQGTYGVLGKILDDYPSTTPIYIDWVQ